MMTAPNVNEYPSIVLQPGYDFAAIHSLIIHTIHTKSIFFLRKGWLAAEISRLSANAHDRPTRFRAHAAATGRLVRVGFSAGLVRRPSILTANSHGAATRGGQRRL